MSVRLFVGNLSYEVTEAQLKELFGEVGAVKMVRVPVDRESGRPRGFAFVDFGERSEGEAAIQRFHQFVFMGRALAVTEAVPREDAARAPQRPMSQELGAPPPRNAGPAPARTFGADALPRNRRKPVGGQKAGKGGPKGPLKETGARVHDRRASEDPEGEDVPFWAVNDDKLGDQE